MFSNIKVIAFDADDTLWVNEPFFREAEVAFCELMRDYLPEDRCNQLLYEMVMENLPLYGYGIKPFTLSLIETAVRLSNGKIPIAAIEELIQRGKLMLQKPVEVLPGVEETLQSLRDRYRLVMATKGDLLDQERKLVKSGLEPYFHHIEIVSDKTEKQYSRLIKHLDVLPEEFLMVGNSAKSDILPVLNIGGHAFHVPFRTTWVHEQVKEAIVHPNFRLLASAREMLALLDCAPGA